MQRTYESYLAKAVPGLLHGLGDAKIDKFCNSGGLITDTWEVTIPTSVTPNTTYEVKVDGISASYKTSSSSTAAELESSLFMAMRTSPLFTSKAEAVLDSVNHKIIITGRLVNTAIAVTTSPTALTATHTTTSLQSLSLIPFGRFVGRKPGYLYNQASLITQASDEVVGITMSTHAVTQVEQHIPNTYAYGASMAVGYKPLDVMNVVSRTSELTGVYTECVEDDIQLTDQVYVSFASGNEGKATKSPTQSIPMSSFAKFERPSQVELGINLVLISFNK